MKDAPERNTGAEKVVKRPMVLGVTGGPGTGKSTVTRMLAALGAQTADADALVRWTYNDRRFRRALAERFGPNILDEDGKVDRTSLAAIVFADEAALDDLEHMVHPAVLSQMMEMARDYQEDPDRAPMLALEIPLLYETGAEHMVDAVLVVAAQPETIRKRLEERGWTEQRIAAVLRSQLSLEDKSARADHVISTDGPIEDTVQAVESLWNRLVGETSSGESVAR